MDSRPRLVFSSPEAISERERAELETAINAALAEADPTGAERCNLAAPSPSKFALDLGTATILLAVLKGGSAAVVTRLIFAVAGYVRSRNRVIEIQAGPNVKLTVHSRLLEDPGAKKNVLEFLERMGALTEPGAQDKVGRLIDAKTATPPSAPVPT
jgi:hypothetical protein